MAERMEMERNVAVRAHQGHLSELKWSLMFFHLLKKFNRKCEPLSLVPVRRLATVIGAAEEDQVVLASALHSTGYGQGHGLVLLIATNSAVFHNLASLVPQLPVIHTKRASRGEVKV